MNIENFYTISYYIIAAVLSGVIFFFDKTEISRKKRHHSMLFSCIVMSVFISALMSIVIGVFRPRIEAPGIMLYAVTAAQFIYFLVHSGLAPMFYVYIFLVSGAQYTRTRKKHILIMSPSVIMAVFVLLDPFFHWVHYLDENYEFHRGWAESIIYLVSAYFLVIAFANIMMFWKAINVRRRWALAFSFFMVISGVLLQMLFVNVTVELMFEALAMLGVLLTVEKEDDRVDAATGVYNRAALQTTMDGFIDTGRGFFVMAVRIHNADSVVRLTDSLGVDDVMRNVADYLTRISDNVYRASQNVFMLLSFERDMGVAYEQAREVKERFESGWRVGDIEIQLDVTLLLASSESQFNTVDSLMLLADGRIPVTYRKRLLSGGDLSFLKRNVDIEDAVLEGITNESYEVYYQPVYGNPHKSVKAAEAMLYLNDESLGRLHPDDFYPAARKNNVEDYLDLKLLNEVCMFISSGIPTELGVPIIGVGISAVQCMKDEFLEEIVHVLKRHGVSPASFNLKVRGFSEIGDYNTLRENIEGLHSLGFRISIDRYGTEDNNLRTLEKMEYDVVDVDLREFVRSSGIKTDYNIIENSVNMIHELGKLALIKGIDDDGRAELAAMTDVDYLQGENYSGAVKQNEFIILLKGMQAAWREEEKARLQNAAKSTFLANMSHEIRTPINAILGMNEMILRKSNDKDVISYAGDIENAGKNLLALVNGILDFSKIESGNMELIETEYDLSSLLNDIVHMFRVRIEGKGLSFYVDIDGSLPDKLYGDELKVKQVLTNLLNNAQKYTNRGSVTLSVKSAQISADVVVLDMSITDTGTGIKEEERDRLFKMFSRLDVEQTRTIEGTGLGLPITAGLIELMGGEIEVESEYGAGSTFSVTIPQRIVSLKPIGNLEERYSRDKESREKYRQSFIAEKARLLVVDDTPINIRVIKELLKDTKVKLDSAMSGPEALERLREKPYDLVLLDYRMPEMDGIETLKELRRIDEFNNRSVPVIVLTANAISGAREQFLREGFDDYIAKPVDARKLEETVYKLLPPDKVRVYEKENDLANDPYLPDEEVIKLYAGSVENNIKDIRGFLKNGDIGNFTTRVHALKSTTFLVGDHELARDFKALEEAGDREDMAFINENTDKVLDSYLKLYEKLKMQLGKSVSDKSDDKPLIDIDTLKDALEALNEFAESMDYNNIGYVLSTLDGYSFLDEDKEFIKTIQASYDRLDYAAIAESIRSRKEER